MAHPVEQHYTREDLLGAIRAALEASGKNLRQLTVDDLAPVDEFHVRGREATEELAHQADVNERTHLLDVGCGIGGPARWVAARFGCRVTGIDLTEEFVRTAAALTEWVGLGNRVSFRQGDALHLPFEPGTFDAAWTQHAAMNIRDKAQVYREVARVLRPDGRFAIYDILQGSGGDLVFPVPWASEPSLSFLARPEEMKILLTQAGFEVLHSRDTTAACLAWLLNAMERARSGARPLLGLHLLMGAKAPQLMANMARNFEEGRVAVYEIACRKLPA